MGRPSASETARGTWVHPEPVAGLRHHGQEEGIHDPREEEEAEDPAQEEGRRGAEEGAGEEGRGEAQVIAERCGTKADLDAASMDDLKKICQQYFDKWYSLRERCSSCSARSSSATSRSTSSPSPSVT